MGRLWVFVWESGVWKDWGWWCWMEMNGDGEWDETYLEKTSPRKAFPFAMRGGLNSN